MRTELFSLAAVLLFLGLPTAASAAERPNVLFLAVDDLNDWITPLGGHAQSVTPNIERLSQRGMLFRSTHCAAPACNPSRAALMTGIRPSTSGVYHNPDPWRVAMPEAVTLPQHFMANGYTALGSGKIYHGGFPDPASWDEYWPSKTRQTPSDPMPAGRPLNGIPNTAHFDWGPVDAETAEMGDAQVADWVIRQLQREYDQPFFLACGMFRPHLPWYVPQKYFDRFPLDSIQLPKVLENDLDDVPPAGVRMARPDGDHAKVVKYHQWHKAVQGYLASIAFCDEQIGRVLDALDGSPYAGNTIIVFWTDHGWHLGEKQHWRKFALWEEATRTPMIIAAPGVQPGSQCTTPVGLIDIYPTLVDLCGLPPREGLDGVSLRRLLENPAAEWERPALTTHGRNNHALRSSQYRYIRYEDGGEELYDHQADPMEWKNLAGDPAYAQVKRDLARWFPEKNVPGVPAPSKTNTAKTKKTNTAKAQANAKGRNAAKSQDP
jgi:arylsulfatase A-like enzyme